MSLWWVFGVLALERFFELWLAARNRKRLLARGGQEYFPESYRSILRLHLLFYLCLLLESYPWQVPLDPLSWFALCAFAVLQLLRYWCIKSLGDFWNTRIILIPGAKVSRRGPYRFLRHPNYLVVTLEFAVIPLLARAPMTLLIFSIANLFLLRRRIALEERALREQTDYAQKFGPVTEKRVSHEDTKNTKEPHEH
jgi:methyltransferase